MTKVVTPQRVPGRTTRGDSRLVMAALLEAVSLAGLTFSNGTVNREVVTWSLAVFGTGIATLVFATRHTGMRRALGEGKLGAWGPIGFAVLFGLASLTWVGPQVGIAAAISPESVVRALQLLLFAQLTWMFGYTVGPGSTAAAWVGGPLARYLGKTQRGLRPNTMWVLFGVSVVGQVLRVLTGNFGYLQNVSVAVTKGVAYGQILSLMTAMCLYAVVADAYHYFKRTILSKFALVVIAVFPILAGMLSGNKEPVLMVGIAFVLAYAAALQRFPVRVVAAGVVVFVVVVFPFVTLYRSDVRKGGLDFGGAVQTAPDVLETLSTDGDLGASTRLFRLRLREVDNVAVIVQRTPEQIDYRPLSEFAKAPLVGLLPRAIWPGKPVIASGYDFSQEYYGLPSNAYTSSAVTQQGDLYRHGGVAVLLIGTLMIGMTTKLFDSIMRPEVDYRYLFYVLAFFAPLVKMELDVVSLLVTVPAFLVGPTVAIWVTSLQNGRTARRHGPDRRSVRG